MKTESKMPPKPNSEKAVKLSEAVKMQTRAPDSDAIRHITYRDVQLFLNLNLDLTPAYANCSFMVKK